MDCAVLLCVAMNVMAVADWGLTLDMENHPGTKELNPILGSHPSRGDINRLFVVGIAAQNAIFWMLPPKPRIVFGVVLTGLRTGAVVNNFAIGLRLNF